MTFANWRAAEIPKTSSRDISNLVARRRQIVEMIAAEAQRTRRMSGKRLTKSVARLRKALEKELSELDVLIDNQILPIQTQNIRFCWRPVFDRITFNWKFRFLKKFKEDLHLTASFALVGCHGLSFLCMSKKIGVRLYVEPVSIGGMSATGATWTFRNVRYPIVMGWQADLEEAVRNKLNC